MAHELSIREDGFVEHAYVGRVGWHGLGNELEQGATLEQWATAAGMDFKILRSVVRYATDRDAGVFQTMPDKHALFRSDTHAPLSIVSDGYKIVQPAQVLEFFRDLVDRAGFTLETAGVLFGGKRFWVLARTNAEAEVGKGDKVRPFLLGCTSCDGTMKTEFRPVIERVVCQNTLSMALNEHGAKVSLTSHRSVFNADEVKAELGLQVHEAFAATMDRFRKLADTRVAEADVVNLTASLFAPGGLTLAEMEDEARVKLLDSKPVQSVVELVLDKKMTGAELDGMDGTAWGWLNGVTEYVDHMARARSVDNRFNNALFGNGDKTKTRALEMALGL